MGHIHILPPDEAERIAAGEVVERPASVLRELVENALDAGATRIEIEAVRGGLESLSVRDDGIGMDADDALAALRRHATSKIRRLADLESLTTLGFRGEALPAIAAVARLELLTAVQGEPGGHHLRAEGGLVLGVEPAARARGTTVTVRDLFFNVPARRKFLRSPAAEFGRLSEALLPHLLAHPAVGFRLRHEDRDVLSVAPAADRRERIGSLWGARFAAALRPVAGGDESARVEGFVSGPDDTRASRRDWFLFINGRPVRDRLLAHAVAEALGTALPHGRQPLVFLHLVLPGALVDVNVHPAKSEVRFADAAGVHRLLSRALRGAIPARSFIAASGGVDAARPAHSWSLAEPAGAWLAPPAEGAAVASRPPEAAGDEAAESWVILAQYRDCFILAHDRSDLMLVDQHAAHERILYERQRAALRAGDAERQALLFPLTVQPAAGAPAADAALLAEAARAGFDAEAFDTGTYLLRALPASLPAERGAAAFLDLLGADAARDVSAGEAGLEPVRHRVAATVACHAAVRLHDPLTHEKMAWILGHLFLCREPLTCPHGRRTVTRWPHSDILRIFDRS